MEDDGEVFTEGVCDVESSIYVAVGKNLKDGKSLLSWALTSFPGKNICLLHVHQLSQSVSLISRKLSVAKAAKTCRDIEHQKVDKLLNQYLHFIEQFGILSGKIWINMNSIEKGIAQIVTHHGVKMLVMGAAAEKYYTKQLSELKSNKAIFVRQQSPVSCHIWFPCKGFLIGTSIGFHSASTVQFSSQRNKHSTLLPDQEEDSKEIESSLCLKSEGKVHDEMNSPNPIAREKKEDVSLLYSLNKSSNPPSETLLEHVMPVEGTINDKLEHAIMNDESSKQWAKSVRQWRTKEDALEANMAEATGNLYTKEIHQRKNMEDFLVRQEQELERLTNQHDQLLKEIQTVLDQNSILERQILENCYAEKELEEKIIQAVELLIRFKEKRDMLLIERDIAVKRAHQFRELVKEDEAYSHISQSFNFSFSDIIEATQNFEPSLKMGDGRFGSVYKGIIRHTKIAIRMLPSCGSQSDPEFNREVEVLSRVRHPNLVTLMGTCTECRSLIYEYLANGNLEDHLVGRSKGGALSWQTRIRIASEICSALIFLHATDNCSVHGNLRPDKVLFDENMVSKISDFGIHQLVSRNDNGKDEEGIGMENDLETNIYLDPEVIEGRELSPESDIYSFGFVLLRLLATRPASSIVRDVKCAIEAGNLDAVLDYSAGDWPLEIADPLAHLGLRCCEEKGVNRPDLVAEVWPVLEPMRDLCTLPCMETTSSCLDSKDQLRRVPPHFVCPIFQEVMKDPYTAADGYTYEADAIKGWLNSGHKTSPMTNLELAYLDLTPNYALYYAIQEWQQMS